jgi:chemosensory pili system protein ChpB (putative protein-glutamate methylesterase)
MPESGRRVVLLARPGAARERLRSALTEVGAELSLEADPTQADVAELAAARPEVVIVALDSVSEQAIDRFDAVLQDPAIDVMFEEADVAANRSGWDAARWVRHLSAKLNRHGDVLPPGAASDPLPLASGVGRRPAAAADDAPVNGPAADGVPADVPVDVPLWSADDALPSPVGPVPAHPLSEEFTPGVEIGDYGSFDPVAAEMVEAGQNADQIIAFDLQLDSGFSIAGASVSAEAADLPSLDLVFESEVALPVDEAPAMQGAALQFNDLSLDDLRGDTAFAPALAEPGLDFDSAALEPVEPAVTVAPASPAPDLRVAAPEPAATAPAGSTPRRDFDLAGPPLVAAPPFAGVSGGHVLELATDDGPIVPAASAARFRTSIDDLERRIASLELVEDRPADASEAVAETGASTSGAVLLVAGIGGPDAVRQLLGVLPEGFPRPVVVQQRLDGGRYDRLVSQLQRASRLPVDLAEPGNALRPGVVHVLPAGVGIAARSDGLCFDESADTFEALPPGDSAVVLLSGCDPALVDALSGPAWTEAFAAGQAADGCYDPAASNALAATGRPTAQPTELAQRLSERWSAG